MKFYDMSHFARSNGKETVQRAHCALACNRTDIAIVIMSPSKRGGRLCAVGKYLKKIPIHSIVKSCCGLTGPM